MTNEEYTAINTFMILVIYRYLYMLWQSSCSPKISKVAPSYISLASSRGLQDRHFQWQERKKQPCHFITCCCAMTNGRSSLLLALLVLSLMLLTTVSARRRPLIRGVTRGENRQLCGENDVDCLARKKGKEKQTMPPQTFPPTVTATIKTTEVPTATPTFKPTYKPTDEPTRTPEPEQEEEPAAGADEETPPPTRTPTAQDDGEDGGGDIQDITPDRPEDEESETFATEGNVQDENGKVSTCTVGPPADSPAPLSTAVSYTYEARVAADADMEQVLADVEESMHALLTEDLLSCEFPTGRKLQSGIQCTSISSAPKDRAFTPGNDICQNVGDDEDCYQVRGGITVSHLPSESDIVKQVNGILMENQEVLLDSNSNLVGLEYTSFSGDTTETEDPSDADADTTDRDSDPASNSFIDDPSQTRPPKGAVVGGVIVAVMALFIVGAALLFVRWKRGSEDATKTIRPMMHDKSNLLDEGSTGSSSDGFRACIINDEADSESPNNVTVDTAEQEYSHDFENCTTPKFINIHDDGVLDLSPPRLPARSFIRPYVVEDTVSL